MGAMQRQCRLVSLAAAFIVAPMVSGSMPALYAQVTGATLSGTVVDPSGNLIPQASVKARNLAQGTERTTTSNSKGEYIFPNLQPGPYEVGVTSPGFRAEKKTGVVLTVGERPVIDFVLSLSTLDQSVEVTDTSSKLELGSASVSAVVTGETTRELPLNGRDWTQLATLQPGIAAIRSQPDATSTASRGNRGFGQQLTISGGRPQQNSYRLDGIVINDYANSAPGSTAGLSLGAEAIQEFSVISSNYSASYGLTSGGVINAITRSGTNQIHGSVYEFLRNDFFDSEFFTDAGNPTGRKLPFRRNQYGATIGAPLWKNKTFFFANYEGFRQVLTSATTSIVPTALARTGALVAGKVAVDPTVARYLPIFPLPNTPLAANSDTGSYIFASKEFTPENFVTSRIDHTFSSQDSLSGIYLYDNGNTTQPDNLNVLTNLSDTVRQVFSLSENHIFSASFYNALRVGLDRESAGTLITEREQIHWGPILAWVPHRVSTPRGFRYRRWLPSAAV